MQIISRILYRGGFAILLLGLTTLPALSQSSAFTYQGRLSDNSLAANGTYQMQFALFDALASGTQIGTTVENTAVLVANGVFTVQLDFGSGAFPGADRYLQLSVRRNSGESYVTLAPRLPITSAPYSTRANNAATADHATTATNATNADQLGNIAASQYVQTSDSRLTDARNPLPGSSNYIQNTTAQQPSSNFNISGNGTVGGNFSVGNNALYVNSSLGWLGVGTLPTLGILSLNGNAGQRIGMDRATVAGASGNTLIVEAGGAASGSVDQNGGTLLLRSGLSTGTGSSEMRFETAAGGTSGSQVRSPQARMRITANGDVGIGDNGGVVLGAQLGVTSSGLKNEDNTALAIRNFTFSDDTTITPTKIALSAWTTQPVVGDVYGIDVQNLSSLNPSVDGVTKWGVRIRSTGGFAGGAGASTTNYGLHVTASGADVNYPAVFFGGNVGIGTGTPQFGLHIVNSSNSGFRVQNNVTGGSVASFGSNGDFKVDSTGGDGGRLTVKENGNVGIGTPAPGAKLQVTGGNVYISNPNSLIITSPNGACWFITVNNAGALSTIPTTCP